MAVAQFANPQHKSFRPGKQQPSIAQRMVTLRLPKPSLRRQRQRTTPETNGRLHWTRQKDEWKPTSGL